MVSWRQRSAMFGPDRCCFSRPPDVMGPVLKVGISWGAGGGALCVPNVYFFLSLLPCGGSHNQKWYCIHTHTQEWRGNECWELLLEKKVLCFRIPENSLGKNWNTLTRGGGRIYCTTFYGSRVSFPTEKGRKKKILDTKISGISQTRIPFFLSFFLNLIFFFSSFFPDLSPFLEFHQVFALGKGGGKK